jgi:hypothetical protein
VFRIPRLLVKAVALGDELLRYSIPGFRGYCWGYPFDWQNNKGLWRRNTPFITCTPYAFEAYLGLFDATGHQRYLEIAASISRFVADDLKDSPCGADAAAASYSPFDDSKVINASAYRAFVLFEAAHRLMDPSIAQHRSADPACASVQSTESSDGASSAPSSRPSPPMGAREEHGPATARFPLHAEVCRRYLEKAWRNLNFILQSQREDGSWLYAVDNPAEAYIDHFHTCFVLKNLVKINRHIRHPRVSDAIQRGYTYYRKHLFDAQDNPRQFAIRPRTQLVDMEMYDWAEAMTLGALLREEIPGAFDFAHELARRLGAQYQLPDGHFVTRVYRGGIRHTFPFLRWPQAQLFHAVTNLLAASDPQA